MRWRLLSPLCLALPLLLPSCRQVGEAVFGKSIAPEVVDGARQYGSWYSYLPARAPGFCLRTERALCWREPGADFGYWRGLHPRPPHRVLMEARGDTFILHRHYVWDGMTLGETEARHLCPTVRHDALYHGLQAGAPFRRVEADRALRRDMRRVGERRSLWGYPLIRCFGGFFVEARTDEPTLLVQRTTPATPAAPLERPDAQERRAVNPVPEELRPQ